MFNLRGQPGFLVLTEVTKAMAWTTEDPFSQLALALPTPPHAFFLHIAVCDLLKLKSNQVIQFLASQFQTAPYLPQVQVQTPRVHI